MNKMKSSTIKIIIFAAFLFLSTQPSYAVTVTAGASAVIEKGNMREANNTSLNTALINVVKKYYKTTVPDTELAPDVTADFIRFIRSYKIINKRVTSYSVTTTVEANLDEIALQDAVLLITDPKDSAVYTFSGIPSKMLEADTLSATINKALAEKNFTTFEQPVFQYEITDQESKRQINRAFTKVDSRYLFAFKFTPRFTKLEDIDNSCELVTTTDITYRDGTQKALKIVTGSQRNNENLCIAESVKSAVNTTVDYIRQNIIVKKEVGTETHSYNIKAINFPNMVSLTQLMSNLKQRGIINDFKTSSFAAKEVTFGIISFFSQDDIKNKIANMKFDIGFSISDYGDGIEFDFSKLPEEPSVTEIVE